LFALEINELVLIMSLYITKSVTSPASNLYNDDFILGDGDVFFSTEPKEEKVFR
jgi:hypothetical protein